MKKKQTDRLSNQQKELEGPKGIFGKFAQDHDLSVNDISKIAFEFLQKEFAKFEFRYRENVSKKEIRNLMINEHHFPYVLFLQGSNFLTKSMNVKRPDGSKIELRHDVGSLNRIDRLTAANYSLPINQNSCENIYISIEDENIMLQAVSIFTKAIPWKPEEMLPIMIDIAKTSLRVMKLIT